MLHSTSKKRQNELGIHVKEKDLHLSSMRKKYRNLNHHFFAYGVTLCDIQIDIFNTSYDSCLL